MTRSKWKGLFFDINVFKKGKVSATRNSCVPQHFLSKHVVLHTGKELKKLFISSEKIGLKAGSFIHTQKRGQPKVLPKSKK